MVIDGIGKSKVEHRSAAQLVDDAVDDCILEVVVYQFLAEDVGLHQETVLAVALLVGGGAVHTKDAAVVDPLLIKFEDVGLVIRERDRALLSLFPFSLEC